MGRMSFTQELKALATAGEGMDGGGWRGSATPTRARTRRLPEGLDDSDQLAGFVAVPAGETH
jgi:hypothetical protein